MWMPFHLTPTLIRLTWLSLITLGIQVIRNMALGSGVLGGPGLVMHAHWMCKILSPSKNVCNALASLAEPVHPLCGHIDKKGWYGD